MRLTKPALSIGVSAADSGDGDYDGDDLMRESNEVALDLGVEIVLWAEACCDRGGGECLKEDSS
jgi:hypothetical protein